MSRLLAAIEHAVTTMKASNVNTLVSGRVYQGVAPAGAKHPLIIVSGFGDTIDRQGLGPDSPITQADILVKVVGKADSLVALEPIHDAVCDALKATHGANSRGDVASCVRISEGELANVGEGGEVIRYLISKYRLQVT